jgi:hypothetical protein
MPRSSSIAAAAFAALLASSFLLAPAAAKPATITLGNLPPQGAVGNIAGVVNDLPLMPTRYKILVALSTWPQTLWRFRTASQPLGFVPVAADGSFVVVGSKLFLSAQDLTLTTVGLWVVEDSFDLTSLDLMEDSRSGIALPLSLTEAAVTFLFADRPQADGTAGDGAGGETNIPSASPIASWTPPPYQLSEVEANGAASASAATAVTAAAFAAAVRMLLQ